MSEKFLTEQLHELYGTSFADIAPDTNPPDRRMAHIDYSEIEARALALQLAARQNGKSDMLRAYQVAEVARITGTNPDCIVADDLGLPEVLDLKTAPQGFVDEPVNRQARRQADKNARAFGFAPTGRKLFRV